MTHPFISEQKLEQLANQLLARHEAKFGRISQPPVPVERILEDTLQLDILWDNVEEPQGETILAGLDPGSRRVVFNDDRRSVFDETPGLYCTVLGHESGHWEAHVDKVALTHPMLTGFEKSFSCLYKKNGPGQGSKEIQASKFMGYLLLPSHLLLPAIKDLDLTSWPNLYQLREMFQVTISSLRIRLERLNLLYVAPDKRPYPSRQEYLGQQRLTP